MKRNLDSTFKPKKKKNKIEKEIINEIPKGKESKGQEKVVEEKQVKDEVNVEEEKKTFQTLSVALPGSVMSGAQTPELRSYLAGQFARIFTLFRVDEVIIFDDNNDNPSRSTDGEFEGATKRANPNIFLARILQYLETPQYMRKALYPRHPDLQFVGLIHGIECGHHLRKGEESEFREGLVLDRPTKPTQGSFVSVGLVNDVRIDRLLQKNVRVTVKFPPLPNEPGKFDYRKGTVVSPLAPKMKGIYWGYKVRLAPSLASVFSDGPYKNGYDCTFGVSEKGKSVDEFQDDNLLKHEHLLLVFGGLKGLESNIDGDEKLKYGLDDAGLLFNHYINFSPNPGTRNLRTEESIMTSLSTLRYILRTSSKE